MVKKCVTALGRIIHILGHNTVPILVHRLHTMDLIHLIRAGKSSFINALLDTDREICKVAAHPMTDTIQQIVYGPNESVTDINDYIKKITQPDTGSLPGSFLTT